MTPNASIISLRTVRIEIFSQDTEISLSAGSGFLCRHNKKLYLVTNWHIVTGRHPHSNQPLHHSGALPGKLRCSTYFASPVEGADENTMQTGEARFEVELVTNGSFNWIEHPEFGSNVDVVAIPVSRSDDGRIIHAFDIDEELERIPRIEVMGEVFIVGYPLTRESTNNMFPIYKSGTVASEPEIHDAEPRFYVDSKTKSGMSGSPVIYVSKEAPYIDGTNLYVPNELRTLVGIYAGRDGIAPTEYEAELGRIWPIKECLLPLLESAGK